MAEYNINELNRKVENEGATSQGRLSAAEFNLLVNAAIESQKKIALLESYFRPISEEEYEFLKENNGLSQRPYFVYEEGEEEEPEPVVLNQWSEEAQWTSNKTWDY